MAYIDEIAEFNMQDGFTPWQVRKLNALVRRVASMLPDTHVVEIRSVEQLAPGSDPYVRNAGDPKVALLEFGIPESVAYTLTKSGNRIVLSGNDGTSMSVEDSDTTYSISKAGDTVTLFGSDGTETSFTDKDTNTTYTLSKSGSKIKLTGSDGSVSQVDVVNADTNTTYTISKSGNTVTLTGSDGSTSSFTDSNTNTTYALSKSGSTIKLTGSDGSSTSVTDSNTTYTLTKSGNDLVFTSSSGNTGTIPFAAVAFTGAEADLPHTYQNSFSSHGYIGSYYDEFDRSKDTLPAGVNRRMFVGYDKGGRTIGAVRMFQNTISGFTTRIEAVNQDSNAEIVTNYLDVRKDRDGEDHYAVQTPENFAFDLNMPFLAQTPNHRIPANADLNAATYRSSYGTYDCTSNATVATLSNCPTTYAFKMWVLNLAYVVQFILDYTGNAYMRLYNNGWENWRKFSYPTLPGSTANRFLATPNGSTGYASYRAIALADLPNSTSGNRWYVNTYVQSDGYMNIGKYLTFWGADAETKQFGQIYFYNTDKPGMYFYAYGTNGERKSALFFGGDNARFPQSGYPKADGTGWLWHFLKAPIVLYDSSSGTTGTVTLAESADNFNYLGIYYCTDNRSYRNYVEVYNPNGKTVNLLASENAQGGQSDLSLYLKSKAMAISGTSMTNTGFGGQAIVSHGDTGTYAYEYKYIKILRVVGFK